MATPDFEYSNLSGRPPGPVLRALSLLSRGVRTVQEQVEPYADRWRQANLRAMAADGPLWVALGDSMTQGIGASDFDRGWVGQLAASGGAGIPSRLINLGTSGARVDDVLSRQIPAMAALGHRPDLVTVLIGSNDLWFAYQNGSENPTPTAEEDAVVATYRKNLERTVQELQDAGAIIVVGLPDDQSLRPVAADIARINEALSEVTQEEVGKMSALSKVLDRTAAEVATAHGVRTVDTNDAFWADPARMAEDGIHPNAAGYAQMAGRWVEAVEPLL